VLAAACLAFTSASREMARALVRISADVDHPFRLMSITYFGRCRSPVSVMAIRHFG
jgi:hypothetical protein